MSLHKPQPKYGWHGQPTEEPKVPVGTRVRYVGPVTYAHTLAEFYGIGEGVVVRQHRFTVTVDWWQNQRGPWPVLRDDIEVIS